MEKEELIKLLDEGLSTREIARIKNVGYSTVSRWTRKYKLQSHYSWNKKLSRNKKLGDKNYLCRVCSKTSDKGLCQGCNTKVRRYRTKTIAVSLKGGKCNRCGWSGNIAGFDFHHIYSNSKEFEISNVANRSWNMIEKELEKCELLCTTCHRIEHSNNEGELFLKEVNSYQGNNDLMIKHFGNLKS